MKFSRLSLETSQNLNYYPVLTCATFLKSLKARKGNNMLNLTVLSWLFPTEEGAKIPHSSVICFGDEISYCKSGIMRRKFAGKFSEDTITSLIEFDNVLGMDYRWLHRCRWRMLETKCVGDNYKMLVTVLTTLVTNIHYLLTLASGTKDITNITVSPTSLSPPTDCVTRSNYWSNNYDIKIEPNLIWNIFLVNAKNDLMQKIIVSSKIIAIISGIFWKIILDGFQFRWLIIKGIYAAFPISLCNIAYVLTI